MKLIKLLLISFSVLAITGCSVSPFSPRSQQKINNNGKIEEIKSNQNGILAEVGKLKQDVDLMNSKLKEVQNGLINISSAISRNENSGVQVLQGDGSLILVFSIIVFGGMLWYRTRAISSERSLNIMAKQVAKYNLAELNDNIIKDAVNAGKGKEILGLLNKAIKEV